MPRKANPNAREIACARRRAIYWRDVDESRKQCLAKYYAKHEHNKAISRAREARNAAKLKLQRREIRKRNAKSRASYNAAYRESHRYIYAAAEKARYAKKKMAMPPWAEKLEILAIYKVAQDVTAATGILHEVDHIVPLQGKNVSGLHVPWNLRVITKAENVLKSNSLIMELVT